MNREQELEYIKSYAGPGIDNPVEFFDSLEKYAALAEKVSDTSPTNKMSEMEKQAFFKTFGKGLNVLRKAVVDDAYNYTIKPWAGLLKGLGKFVHGDNVTDMGFYKWLDKLHQHGKGLSEDLQRYNNDLWGYGMRTNEELAKKVKDKFEFLDDWTKGQEAWLKKGDEHVQILTNKGEAWTGGTVDKYIKDKNVGLRKLTANDEKGWTQVGRVKNKLYGQHPGRHLGRQLTYWAPGFIAPMFMQEGLGDLAAHTLGESGRTYVDKFFSHAHPLMAGLQLPMDATWAAAHLSKPLLKDYFRTHYYNNPKDILSWLYKLFNPEGYKWKVASEVDKQLDEYLKHKTGGEMLLDAWGHVTK